MVSIFLELGFFFNVLGHYGCDVNSFVSNFGVMISSSISFFWNKLGISLSSRSQKSAKMYQIFRVMIFQLIFFLDKWTVK